MKGKRKMVITNERLANLFQKIAQLKILVVGDLMLDRYIFGDANRISPEAPVPVVDIEMEKDTLGAAANVALNLRSLGVDVTVCGTFGSDTYGEQLRHLLSMHAIKVSPCSQKEYVRTILKTRVIVRNQQLCRLDIEDEPEKYRIDDEKILEQILDSIPRYNAIIFSDYAKGTIYQSLADRLICKARAHDVIVAVDPKPKNNVQFFQADILKPNYAEALEISGVKLAKMKIEFADLCTQIFIKQRPKNLVITLGREGMLVSSEGKVGCKVPSYAREVFDVSGAGDTSIAFLTAAYTAGETIEVAAHVANMASGIVVGKIGTAVATTDEMLNENKFE